MALVLFVFLTILRLERPSLSPPEIAPPWIAPVPAMAPQHIESAKELARYLRILPGDGYQERIRGLTWTTFWQHRPIGNLHRSSLRKLLVGHWFVHRETPRNRDIPEGPLQVLYFGTDGIMWMCASAGKDGYRLRRYRYEIANDLVGAATYVVRHGGNRDDEAWLAAAEKSGFEWVQRPIIFDSITGTFVVHHAEPIGQWYRHAGHLQREYHPAFSALCPDFPRFIRSGSETYQGIVPWTYKEFRESINRHQIMRNVRTLFRQDPYDPLTMGMYFALYPPPEP